MKYTVTVRNEPKPPRKGKPLRQYVQATYLDWDRNVSVTGDFVPFVDAETGNRYVISSILLDALRGR